MLFPTEGLLDRALELAIDLAHLVCDCVYLSLAVGTGARLVSADRRFVAAVRRHAELADRIALLGETVS